MISHETMVGLSWPALLPHLAGFIHRTAFSYVIVNQLGQEMCVMILMCQLWLE